MAFLFKSYPTVAYEVKKNNKKEVMVDITKRFVLNSVAETDSTIFYDYYVKDSDTPDSVANKYYEDPTMDWLIFITNDIIDPLWNWPLKQRDLNKYINNKYTTQSLISLDTSLANQVYDRAVGRASGTTTSRGQLEDIAFDVNGDGNISLQDAADFQNLVLGNDTTDQHVNGALTAAYLVEYYGASLSGINSVHHFEEIKAPAKSINGKVIPQQIKRISYTTYNTLPASRKKIVTNKEYEEDLNEQRRTIKLVDKSLLRRIQAEAKNVFG